MADLNFILLYVEDVAASEAFYAKVFGRPAIEVVADLRHDPRRAGRHARPVAARRRRPAGRRARRRRDRDHGRRAKPTSP